MSNDYKMIKNMFKFLQHLMQDFYHVFDHFVETSRYRIKFPYSVSMQELTTRKKPLFLSIKQLTF